MSFTRYINNRIDQLLLGAIRLRGLEPEKLHVEGIIRIAETPWIETEEDYRRWLLVPASEQERYVVAEFRNIPTTNGRNLLMRYASSSANNVPPFAQFFAVGTGALVAVAAADTSLVTELYRAAPTSQVLVGTQLDIKIAFTGSNGQGTWTNAGLFGANATALAGSGTLTTHVITRYVKGSTTVTVDYLLSIQ